MAFSRSCLVLVFLATLAPASAYTVADPASPLASRFIADPSLRVTHTIVEEVAVRQLTGFGADVAAFQAEHGEAWQFWVDQRTGRVTVMDGGAIPFLTDELRSRHLAPGAACAGNACIPVAEVEALGRAFLRRYQRIFKVEPDDLVLLPLGSLPVGESLYFLRFQWVPNGIPVEGATVSFIINHGNLIQVGLKGIGDLRVSTVPRITAEDARSILDSFLGSDAIRDTDRILDSGSLELLPITPRGDDPEVFNGRFGQMADYVLAYRITFDRPEITGTWEGLVDAATGQLLRFVDVNRYGTIHGGIRPSDGLPPEEDHPFPGADTDNGARNTFTDNAGNFPGNSATTQLKGKYCIINDSCGSISGTTAVGEIDFLSGPTGTVDCATPVGNTCGNGNTRATRTIFWNVSNLNVRAQVWNPSNTWLTNKNNAVTVNVNQSPWCNATAGGGVINFYRRAAGCNNLGEIPGVAMHEWGHLYDTNDGSGQQDRPVEAYADFIAIMSTHNSCLGAGFLTSGNCSGYGNPCTNCTGIRDADYAKHNPATPWTSANHGTVWDCGGGSYNGPCGWEDHCEAGIATQAMWDLATRDLSAPPTNLDIDTAWALMDRLWFTGVITMDDFYTCSGGVTSGCGASNTAYRVLRAVDDDGDGTANGTPHAAAIYAALARHGIACGAAGDATNQNQTTCPTLNVTTLSGAPSNNRVDLSWTAVPNATRYWILRNEGTCSSGFTRIATVNAPATTYADTAVANGTTYNYRFQAATASDACASAVSNCFTTTPVPCSTPGVPTIGTVTVPGTNQLRVSFTAGSPAGATYKIYRAILASSGSACTTGTYSLLASGVASSPYTDSTVSGTLTYGYKVSAVDGTGLCESAQSGCAKGTATGVCNAPPAFAGLATVTNPAQSTCAMNLAWAAGTAFCGGPLTYNVHRSLSTPFTPTPGNRIAQAVSGTTYSDTTVSSGVTYYYIVQAVDGANGVNDGNTIIKSGAPSGPPASPTTYYTNNFETGSGLGGWSVGTFLGGGSTADWRGIQTCTANSGTKIFRYGATTCTGNYATGAFPYAVVNGAGGVAIPAATSTTRLTFSHRYRFETGYDGGTLRVSTDGSNYADVPAAAYLAGAPAGTSAPDCAPSGASGLAIWSGAQTSFSAVTVDLDAACNAIPGNTGGCTGKSVRIAFTTISDCTLVDDGWFLDDVTVTAIPNSSCTTASTSPKEASPAGSPMTSVKGSGQNVNVTYTPACGATDHAIFRGQSPISGAASWTAATCAIGTSGTTTFNAGTPAAGTFAYWVVVGQTATEEGSYGLATSGERPQATGVGSCDRPQDLTGSCP